MINFRDVVRKNVSRETLHLIEVYINNLYSWNRKFNLISRNLSKEKLYCHIYDAILISETIKDKKKIIVDVGTGGGLPGIILAILGHHNLHLVDMDRNKIAFLREMLALLETEKEGLRKITADSKADKGEIKIYHEKIENFTLPQVDYIVSKAMTSITDFISLTKYIKKPQQTDSNKLLLNPDKYVARNVTFVVLKTLAQLTEELKLINLSNFQLRQYENPYRNNSLVVHLKSL